MVTITGRVTKIGNSYGVIIPKALINANVLKERELITLELLEEPRKPKDEPVSKQALGNDFTEKISLFKNLSIY